MWEDVAMQPVELRAIVMKRAFKVLAMLLLSGCGAVPQQDGVSVEEAEMEQAIQTVQAGHLCDPLALVQVIVSEHQGIDPATAQREADHIIEVSRCDLPGPSAPTEQQQATSPLVQSRVSAQEIPLQRKGNEYTVPVRINDTITLPFILDTGATELLIPADVALTLIRTGALSGDDFLGKRVYSMANGSEQLSERVLIRKVQVGDHTVNDVTASVSPPTSEPLLGESFLSKFGTVTIDYNRLILTLSP
jgi:clan AA aspartic protease (TIGR02281 family)